jgi:GDP-4-dehydro-6-deoxy-D-mannose reductase
MELLSFEEVFAPQKFDELRERGYLIDTGRIDEYQKSIAENKSAAPDKNYWKEKRVLITGSAGMVGSILADILIDAGADVYGTVKRHAVNYYPNIQHNIDNGKLKTVEIDLRDYGGVMETITEIEPHVIFHQAAESFVPTSIKQPSNVVENNCVSTVNILEAATKADKSLEGIQFACSSEQYGFVRGMDELPVKETNELRPTSTYAATKVFTEKIAKAYYYMYKTPTVITRTFNQEGPRRGPQFFTARIARQIADCLNGKADKIVMGNPNSIRDFTHADDSVKAQIIAVEKCNRGEPYNICSGKGITTGDYLKLGMRINGLEGKTKAYIDKRFLRPYERGEALMDGFIGDNSKFVEKTGWSPTKSVVDIINDGVERWKK